MENTNNIKSGSTPPNSFIFKVGEASEPVIIIDQQGFWYKGELVEDAGEVYRMFKEFIGSANEDH